MHLMNFDIESSSSYDHSHLLDMFNVCWITQLNIGITFLLQTEMRQAQYQT